MLCCVNINAQSGLLPPLGKTIPVSSLVTETALSLRDRYRVLRYIKRGANLAAFLLRGHP